MECSTSTTEFFFSASWILLAAILVFIVLAVRFRRFRGALAGAAALMLLVFAFARFKASQARARIRQTKIEIASTVILIEKFKEECGRLPNTLAELEKPDACAGRRTTFLGPEPQDSWGRPLLYLPKADSFELKSFGCDGKEGGEAMNLDITFSSK